MPKSLDGLISKAIKFARDNWKAVVFFIITVVVAPSLYAMYQDHAKDEETKSLIDSSLRKADSLEDAGELKEAIDLYEEILKSIPPNNYPSEYARAQNGLGVAYHGFALIQNKEGYLKRAIQAYNEALKIRTLESYPIDYALTQNNLGAAYTTLADVRDKEYNLEKAIQAYQEALKVRTLESYPIDYAITQNNLGAAYTTLADVRDKEYNLEKAIQSHNEALKIFTFDSYPIYYSRTRSNLASARNATGINESRISSANSVVLTASPYEERYHR